MNISSPGSLSMFCCCYNITCCVQSMSCWVSIGQSIYLPFRGFCVSVSVVKSTDFCQGNRTPFFSDRLTIVCGYPIAVM